MASIRTGSAPLGSGATWASGREETHRARRHLIIRTAARLFAEKGYENASIDEVADILEVSKPTIYYYLKNKEALLVEIVLLAIEQLEEMLVPAPDSTGLQRAQAFARAYVSSLLDDLGRCMMRNANSWRGSDSAKRIRKAQRGLQQKLTDAIELGVRDGSIRTENVTVLAMTIFGALHTLPVWYRKDGPLALEEIVDMTMNIILDGVRGTPASRDAKVTAAKKSPRARAAKKPAAKTSRK
jgi:AcrR family transcriptional regulator